MPKSIQCLTCGPDPSRRKAGNTFALAFNDSDSESSDDDAAPQNDAPPSDDGAAPPTLLSLPSECLARVVAFETSDLASMRRHARVCRAQREALSPASEVWLGLASCHFRASAAEARAWGDGAARALYEDLAAWTPRQGVYTLAGGFPWGGLVVVRIRDGFVRGEIVRWLPRAGSWEYAGPFDRTRAGFRETGTVFFEGRLGAKYVNAVGGWLEPEELRVDALEPEAMLIRLNHAAHLFDVKPGATLFDCPRALRLSSEGLSEVPTVYRDVLVEDSDVFWAPDPRVTSILDGPLKTNDGRARGLAAELFYKCECCDLALVRPPTKRALDTGGLESLRPGLYVGDYGARYGRFRTEVVLLESVVLDIGAALRDLDDDVEPAERKLFNRPRWCVSDDASDLALSREAWGDALADLAGSTFDTPLTFVKATKVCGDIYVPMGAVTFVALVDPPEAVDALRRTVGAAHPRVVDRQTGAHEDVVRHWPGLGALAFLGFHHFSWSPGNLVRLGDAPDGSHKFGFAWERDQDAIVLHWIAAQDAAEYLERR